MTDTEKFAVWSHVSKTPVRQQPFTLTEAAEKLEINATDAAFCMEEYDRCDTDEYVIVRWGQQYPGEPEEL